jgi:hypothetical protein
MHELIDLRLKKDWDALAEHPFQADMLYQIVLQLQAAIKYAYKKGDQKYIDQLSDVAKQVNTLVENKQDFLAGHAERVAQSPDYQTMRRFLEKRLGVDI